MLVLLIHLLFLVYHDHTSLCYSALVLLVSQSLVKVVFLVELDLVLFLWIGWVAIAHLKFSSNGRFPIIARQPLPVDFIATSTIFESWDSRSASTSRSHATTLSCVCWVLLSPCIVICGHLHACYHHRVIYLLNWRHSLLNKTINAIVWHHLIELIDLWPKLKIFRNCLYPLTARSGIRDPCWISHIKNLILVDWWPWCEYLPQLECALQLYHLNSLHIVLIHTWGILFLTFGSKCDLVFVVLILCAVKDSHVSTSSARYFWNTHLLDICLNLRSAVDLISWETRLDERVDVNTNVNPALSDDHTVWYSCVHLIVYDVLRPITKHQSSPEIAFVSYMDLDVERVSLAYIHLKHQELVNNVKWSANTHLLCCSTSIMEICLQRLRIWWQLNSLPSQKEYISFDFWVEFFMDFLKASRNGEGFVRLWP